MILLDSRMTLYVIVKETKGITVTSVCNLTGTPPVSKSCIVYPNTHFIDRGTDSLLSHAKVMLNARQSLS